MTDPLIRRRDAAQKTLDTWSRRPMKLGTSDCVRMTASHLRLLGYAVRLPSSGSYRTVNSALKALKARGYDNLAAALDDMGLERIAPAAAIVGDVLMLPAADHLNALVVALGNGRVVGYHEEVAAATVLQPIDYEAAWRAL
ncbi:hypothetical protein [uncultured Sphingomonas sp.]|uniref:DUF6950 family protein n=1 Tax=uncultured Sphingomonas sp. TaxID=158754 RepID=UPI0025F50EEF|nr:hypothetical protein [uncultured Sphingomonas sp.]